MKPHIELVTLRRGAVLCAGNERLPHAYFPTHGVISLVGTCEEGLGVEIGMVGREGFLGLNIMIGKPTQPYHSIVPHTGEALRLPADALHNIVQQRQAIRDGLLSYARVRIAQLTQSAICNRFHPLEQRLCRWLLSAQDRVHSNRLPLTQEFLSQMVGGRRPSVGKVTNSLQEAGLIEYHRGQLTILNRKALEQAACECYQIVKNEIDDLLKESHR
ncbi:MAG: Crp/Fnr family transcriptional regulator [Nitrospiraceae bacterium]